MTEKDLNNVREAIILAALKVIQRVSDETNSVKKMSGRNRDSAGADQSDYPIVAS